MNSLVRNICLKPSKLTFSFRYVPWMKSNRYYSDDDKRGEEKLSALLGNLKKSGRVANKPRSEIELNLAKPRPMKPIKRTPEGKPRPNPALDTRNLDSDVVDAAKSVANMKSTKQGRRRTESTLLKKLQSISRESLEAKGEDEVAGENGGDDQDSRSLGDLVSNLKIDTSKKAAPRGGEMGLEEESKKRKQSVENAIRVKQERQKELTMEQLAFLQKRQKLRRQELARSDSYTPLDIFGGTPIGIFTSPSEEVINENQILLKTWEDCHERNLRILSTPSPRNALEEMILWTEQGKLWHFPVDNEQGLEYSKDPFYNHVFLEHYLEPWCPKGGPIRHFMELVSIGLSKNPYISSTKKRDTIFWFKAYFEREDNHEILVHAGYWSEKGESSISG